MKISVESAKGLFEKFDFVLPGLKVDEKNKVNMSLADLVKTYGDDTIRDNAIANLIIGARAHAKALRISGMTVEAVNTAMASYVPGENQRISLTPQQKAERDCKAYILAQAALGEAKYTWDTLPKANKAKLMAHFGAKYGYVPVVV